MNCDEYLRDPEANAAHLDECEICRATLEDLDSAIDVAPLPIDVDALPIAGWEGASHRTWPLVASAALAILSLAIVLFVAAGTATIRSVARALASSVPPTELVVKVVDFASGALHNAPPIVHLIIGTAFVVVNSLLYLLLRRPPKGTDA